MNKIIGVSDGINLIPVHWGLNVDDIKLHNALILGTVMARRIDTARLWNGTIYLDELTNTLTMQHPVMSPVALNDGVSLSAITPIAINISESIAVTTLEAAPMTIVEYNGICHFPAPTITVTLEYISSTEFRVTFANAVVFNGEPILSAFIIRRDVTPIVILSANANANVVSFTMENISALSGGSITFYYDGETGNLVDYWNDCRVASCSASITI